MVQPYFQDGWEGERGKARRKWKIKRWRECRVGRCRRKKVWSTWLPLPLISTNTSKVEGVWMVGTAWAQSVHIADACYTCVKWDQRHAPTIKSRRWEHTSESQLKANWKCACISGAVYISTPANLPDPTFRFFFFKGLVPRLQRQVQKSRVLNEAGVWQLRNQKQPGSTISCILRFALTIIHQWKSIEEQGRPENEGYRLQ